MTLSRPSLNDVCSPFATSYCCTIAEVSLTIILCVPLYHGDISSLAKAGPSLYLSETPSFFLPSTHSPAAAVHGCCLPPLCVEQGAVGISTSKAPESNLCLCNLHVIYRPSLLHLSPGKLKPDQVEILCMSQRGESIPLGLGDVGFWSCATVPLQSAQGHPLGCLLVGKGPLRSKQVFPLLAVHTRHHCHQSGS